MNTFSISLRLASAPATAEHSFRAVALFSCAGLTVSLCLVAFGVNLGLGWA
jgi:divalent metal cation (Fe/Co/Zn/Cd) transporter